MSKFLNGIFCLEGFWSTQSPSYSAIKPALKAVHESTGIRVIHHYPVTLAQLKKYINEWCSPEYSSYGVLCLSFHGDSGLIWVGSEIVTLDEIASWISGRGNGRMVYFSSCATLSMDMWRIRNFMELSNLSRLAGYENYVSIGEANKEDEETLYRLLTQNLSKKTAKTNRNA